MEVMLKPRPEGHKGVKDAKVQKKGNETGKRLFSRTL